MSVTKIGLRDTQSFSSFFCDYVEGKEHLAPYYGLRPEIEQFKAQIDLKKNFSAEKRNVLCQALTKQYDHLQNHQCAEQIELLADAKTFTVTTGHQLNIFTGPLYFIYKIVTVINTCKALKAEYPEYNFVPVYWMATEDHDFEEISYFYLFGKKYEWHSTEKGGVGRFSSEGLKELLDQLPERIELFERAYLENDNLANAVRYYVNELFGDQGLVIVDGDDPLLKAELSSIIKDDITNHTANQLVEQTNQELNDLGYKTQIYPREINFFYLDQQLRERIVKVGNDYQVNNTDLVFSQSEILSLIDNSPEKFSPNVVMRPLYQETILPNLAYSGGPAEVIYWMQLGKVFDHYETAFPILLPRSFALVINAAAQKRIDKFDLTDLDLFRSESELQSDYLARHGQSEMNLNGEVKDLQAVFDHLIEKAEVVDSSLKGFIGAEHAKAVKSLENIEKRLKKSEERKHETALNQLAALKQKLFPDGGLQERHDNFLNFYVNDPNFINTLLDTLDPFDMQMHVLRG